MSLQSLRFSLFIVCTGILFVRPTELVESLQDAPLYEVVILCCLGLSAPVLMKQVTSRSLKANPVTFCVLGLLLAVGLSHLSHFEFGEAAQGMISFLKVVLSYLLLVGVVNSTIRLRVFLGWVLVFIFTLTALALLQHYEIIDNPALAAHQEHIFDEETGAVLGVNVRLCGAGIFANPNDLSRVLAVGIVLCLYFLQGRGPIVLKPVWLVLLVVFGHALVLTQSRGGLIGLIASLGILGAYRFGVTRTLLLAGLGMPVLMVALGGRQTELSTDKGTGQERIRLWSEGLDALKSSPLFGTGMNTYPQLTGGLAAHNSFVHAYTELGYFGGTLFLGAVLGALWGGVIAIRRGRSSDPAFRRLGISLLAILAGYAAGMLSSSRCYAFPTYYFLGMLVVYARLARVDLLQPRFRVSTQSVLRLGTISTVTLLLIQLYVMVFARFGSTG